LAIIGMRGEAIRIIAKRCLIFVGAERSVRRCINAVRLLTRGNLKGRAIWNSLSPCWLLRYWCMSFFTWCSTETKTFYKGEQHGIRNRSLSGGNSRDSNYEAHLTFGLIHVSIRNVDGLKGGGVAPAHSTHDTVMANPVQLGRHPAPCWDSRLSGWAGVSPCPLCAAGRFFIGASSGAIAMGKA